MILSSLIAPVALAKWISLLPLCDTSISKRYAAVRTGAKKVVHGCVMRMASFLARSSDRLSTFSGSAAAVGT